jgi:hypothetical protein
MRPRDTYLAEIGTRLAREIPSDKAAHFPVNALLPGRRNNAPDLQAGVPPLAVYNPIHYQELPELFMDMISSLTGKSPSTTGFGSEGALTKGPFNAMPGIIDVNNALVSAILTGYPGFTTAAGYVGPKYRVDHDNSMLVPELWCRMRVWEREAAFLIQNGYLEKVEDLQYQGRTVFASRLGYRITASFVDRFLGRIFEIPGAVFPEELLRPEKQDLECFVAGVDAIVEAQRSVACNYFEDETISVACPPIRALLHIMAYGNYQGMRETDPEFRQLFTREALLASDWYRDRLRTKQTVDIALWKRHRTSLQNFLAGGNSQPSSIDWHGRLAEAEAHLAYAENPSYIEDLKGTIGADCSVVVRPLCER